MGESMIESLVKNPLASEFGVHVPQGLPSGTLTFLFTDIEDSTHFWEQYPVQMRVSMKRHDELIEAEVMQHDGVVVRPRGEGDSRFSVFTRATNALLAAIEIQRLLFAEPWPIPTLRVRIALHTGEADLHDGDYYGSAVNRCARLRNAAHGGQILLSENTRCLVRDELPNGVSLRDLGEYILRGLERPEHVFQPIATGLPAEFPPLNTPDQICNNLPLALTSFIGRESEIEELEHLLSRSRLLTITGTGGAGKTRLAIQVVRNIQGLFPDGVWFIDLASLTRTSLLSQHVMNVLGIREQADIAQDQTLLDALSSKSMLIILDNCEHLLPGVAQLAEKILYNTSRVQLLATSREKLGASGEIIWLIPPLCSPDSRETIEIEKLMQYESVKLFQDRATAARSDFAITKDNIDAVAKICAHLDGIPLAIELAAARVRVLSVEDIVKRLDDRFRLLVGSNTALPRQQTLRAMIDWSYDLLTEKERILLRRLAVFMGGWTLEAAEQVCPGGEVEDWEVLDLLTGLIDKSFVSGESRDGHQRYRFLETIQKFSQERLVENHESEVFAQKHAAYYLKMTVNSYGKEWGPEQARRLMWLDEEYDNLRSVLDWSSQVSGSEEQLLQLAGSLWRYWEIRGYLTEGRVWLEIALAKNSNASGYWRANGLGGAGHLARQQGDYVQAQALHEQSLKLFRKMGLKLDIARQLNALGEIARFQGDYSLAVELHEESQSIRKEIGDKEGIAVSLRQLGVIARDRGQYKYAKELLEESLRLERELSDKLYIALSLNELGLVTYHLCEYERANSLFEEAIFLQREVNDRLGISNSLQNLGNVAKDQGDFKRAVRLYNECLVLNQELGDKRGISRVIAALAEVALLQGKYSQAADLAMQSLTISQDLGLRRGVLAAFELLGFIAYYQGDYKTAVSYSEISLELATELDAPQAIGYAKLLLALDLSGEGSLQEARDAFQEALVIFQDINDCRNVAGTYVNLARTAYYQRDYNTAYQYLEDSLVISLALKISWVKGFVYETKGMLQCSEGNIEGALASFQESLRISDDQENLQRISNCFMALAAFALAQNEARRAVRLFAAAARLRHDMGVKISSNDRVEYEQHLALVHEHLDHATFEAEWSEGFSMTTQKIMEDLNEWLDEITGMELADSPTGQCETHRLHHALPESPKLTANSIVCSKGWA